MISSMNFIVTHLLREDNHNADRDGNLFIFSGYSQKISITDNDNICSQDNHNYAVTELEIFYNGGIKYTL
jgi:hypothetical protein